MAKVEIDEDMVAKQVDPVTGKTIRFKADSRKTEKRAVSMWNKEEYTITWLRGMKPGDHLFDIGANIGVYTLFASVVSGAKVTAFEPEAQNYGRLNENIYLNDMSKLAIAYPFAAADRSYINTLNIGKVDAGNSGHQIAPFRQKGKQFHTQGTYAISMDDFHAQTNQVPTHIKIDVDGIEPLIIKGMSGLLKNERVRDIQVEINTLNKETTDIDGVLQSYGFKKYNEYQCNTANFQNWNWSR